MNVLLKTLIICLLVPSIAFGGIFGRRSSNCRSGVCAVQSSFAVPQVQNIVINNNYPQTQYAYTAPLLGVSPAVIERHSYDLATTASLAYSTNALQALRVSENIMRLQAISAVGVQPLVALQTETTLGYQGIRIGPPRLPMANVSILNDTCAKCHGANLASPKGELFLTTDMSDVVRLKALKMVRADKMPPNKPLTIEQKASFYEELLR